MNGAAPTSPFPTLHESQEPGNPSAEAPDRSTPLAGCFTQQTRAEPHPWSSPLTACAPAHSPPTNPTADQPRPTPQQEPTTASPRLFLQAPAPTAFVAGHSSLVGAITTGAAPTFKSHRVSTSIPTVRVVYVFAKHYSLKY